MVLPAHLMVLVFEELEHEYLAVYSTLSDGDKARFDLHWEDDKWIAASVKRARRHGTDETATQRALLMAEIRDGWLATALRRARARAFRRLLAEHLARPPSSQGPRDASRGHPYRTQGPGARPAESNPHSGHADSCLRELQADLSVGDSDLQAQAMLGLAQAGYVESREAIEDLVTDDSPCLYSTIDEHYRLWKRLGLDTARLRSQMLSSDDPVGAELSRRAQVVLDLAGLAPSPGTSLAQGMMATTVQALARWALAELDGLGEDW